MTGVSFHHERISSLFELEVSDAYKITKYCSLLGLTADQLQRKGFSNPVSEEALDGSLAPGMMFTPSQRQLVGEWFLLVADRLSFCREIGALSMKFFDTVMARRLMKGSSAFRMNQQGFHVLAVTCLFIALKLYKGSSRAPILASSVCEGVGARFSTSRVIEEEREVLDTLEWRMYPPLPLDFVHSFLGLLLFQWNICEYLEAILDRAYYMIDLSAPDYFFLDQEILPSCIALSALSNGLAMIFTKEMFKDPMIVVSSQVKLNFGQETYELCRLRLQILWDSNTTMGHGPRMPSPVSVMCENIV